MTIRQLLRVLALGFMVCLGFVAAGSAVAAEAMKPFVLGSTARGSLEDALGATKAALEQQKFRIVGEYSPFEGAHVIVVTNDFLAEVAAKEAGGAYLLGVRVSVTQVGGNIQVSYINPEYWRNAYRVKRNFTPITAKLSAALGSQEEFGSKKGLKPSKLKKYHYTFGMEYFDDPMKLGSYPSHKEAVSALEKNFEQGVAGTSMVYRIDVPGSDITVFGVAMTEGMSSDAAILEEVDAKPLKHVAHLPYEVAVFDGEVRALHPRFRIAISWPDLKMVGANSFYGITKSPREIQKALTQLAGGQVKGAKGSGGFSVQ